jgi:hypothetical protein
VKQARPPLVRAWKHGTGGRSGLHRAAQELTALHREVRIRATETSLSGPWPGQGETGNLCAQQHQVGPRRSARCKPWASESRPGARERVGGTEPWWRHPAQRNGGHGGSDFTVGRPHRIRPIGLLHTLFCAHRIVGCPGRLALKRSGVQALRWEGPACAARSSAVRPRARAAAASPGPRVQRRRAGAKDRRAHCRGLPRQTAATCVHRSWRGAA